MLIGVECPDHVGVIEQSHDFDFPEKPLSRVLRGRTDRQDDLRRNHAIHQLMAGLEYTAHGTYAQAVQQDVTAKHEALALANQQPPRLELGEVASLNQSLCQGRRFLGLRLGSQPGTNRMEAGIRQDTGPLQQRKEIVSRCQTGQ